MATEKLSTNQLQAIQLLLIGTPVGKVAKACKVDVSTVWDWRQMPEFKAELERKKHEFYEETTSVIRGMIGTATEQLSKLLVDPNTPVATKLKATEFIISCIKPQQHQLDILEATKVLIENNAIEPQVLDKINTAFTTFEKELKSAFRSQTID